MKELLFIQHQTTLFYGIETIGAHTVIGIGCDVSSLYNMYKYLPPTFDEIFNQKYHSLKEFLYNIQNKKKSSKALLVGFEKINSPNY